MANKRYYWLKLEEQYFDSKIQKAIKKNENGNDILLCYLKLQLKYLKTDGLIEYQGICDNLFEEIALDIDEDVDLIKQTISILIKYKAVEQEENNLYLIEMQERIGSKTDSALRVAKHREKMKILEAPKKEAKSNALRQKQFRAKEYCGKNNIPYIEDYINNKRYNGNYYLVIKRDELQCKICHSQDNLCVHHIDGYDELKPQNSNENKMVTLCRKCHSNLHNSNIIIDEKILESIDYYGNNDDSNKFCNTDVTKCNPIKRREEIEKDKREEKRVEVEKTATTTTQNDIFTFIEKNFGRTLSPIEYQEILNWVDNELTRYAISQAILNGVHNIKYISRILENYKTKNIRTVIEAQIDEQRFKKKNNNKISPEWLENNIEEEIASDEEIKALEQRLNNKIY